MHATMSKPTDLPAAQVLSDLKKHILVDGFQLVFDLSRSSGSRFYDANKDRMMVDFYGFYASQPVGFNHPYFEQPEVREELADAALVKVANSDVYTRQFARFVDALARVVGVPQLDRYFFIEGGALAVENALKAAMDWKVQKNIAAGRGEIGTEVLHLKNCFHGRSGYTMSLTNTDPNKVRYFAKFDWPRISAPFVDYELPEAQRTKKAVADEAAAEAEILAALARRPNRICCIIIEPIQGEGGDRHFRPEWFATLRRICNEHEMILIYDEVQCGMGITGKNWCFQHHGVFPDVLCFGKKAQVCGIMASSARFDEVKENVFRKSSRINSTWGGNFTDMVRSTHYLHLYEREGLVDNARQMGQRLRAGLDNMAAQHPGLISAVRGLGLMVAFTLPDAAARDAFWKACYEAGLLVIRSGEKSIRLRPVLDVKPEVIDEALALMHDAVNRMPR